MIDFIIIGKGLAANVIAHQFLMNKISFKIIGNENLSNCSKIAAGIWNPIVFKRLTKSWLADDIIPELNSFYNSCEKILDKKLLTHRYIIKSFNEAQEKKLWFKKYEENLINYLDENSHSSDCKELINCKMAAEYSFVKQAGNLDVLIFLNESERFFKPNSLNETFDYNLLKFNDKEINYKSIKAKNIIFCEGYLVKNNPFFNWIPLKPAKGEIVTIKTPDLKFKNKIINKNGFLMDVSAQKFILGSTYDWNDLTQNSTQKGLSELKIKLEAMISCNYTILSHDAAIRPASIDRRPIIGNHPVYKNLFVFNGLGTKGVMLAPFFSKNFVNFYLQKEALHPQVNINRFYKKYV